MGRSDGRTPIAAAAARIARNTQLQLQLESGTTRPVDPWGGSYYVERLTHELAARAQAAMAAKAGGRWTVPQIFIGERHVGGSDDIHSLDAAGGLDPLLAA